MSIVLFTSSVLAEEFKKPSTAEVESSIIKLVKKGLTSSWGSWANNTVEDSTTIDEIKVQEFGIFNTERNNWPLKIIVVGSVYVYTKIILKYLEMTMVNTMLNLVGGDADGSQTSFSTLACRHYRNRLPIFIYLYIS